MRSCTNTQSIDSNQGRGTPQACRSALLKWYYMYSNVTRHLKSILVTYCVPWALKIHYVPLLCKQRGGCFCSCRCVDACSHLAADWQGDNPSPDTSVFAMGSHRNASVFQGMNKRPRRPLLTAAAPLNLATTGLSVNVKQGLGWFRQNNRGMPRPCWRVCSHEQ